MADLGGREQLLYPGGGFCRSDPSGLSQNQMPPVSARAGQSRSKTNSNVVRCFPFFPNSVDVACRLVDETATGPIGAARNPARGRLLMSASSVPLGKFVYVYAFPGPHTDMDHSVATSRNSIAISADFTERR